MGKKEKKKTPPGPKGAPEWVVTFTDMISLLVTFFILLLTFSSLEENDVVKVDAWLFGKRGVMDGRGSALAESPESDLVSEVNAVRGAKQAHARPPDGLDESLVEMGQNKTEAHQEISFSDTPDGLVLEFGEAEAFAPGSDRVNSSLAQSLAEIGRVLENYQHLIVVEAFTDDAFRETPLHRTPEALSFSRAQNAAEAMLTGSSVVSDRVQIAGLGQAQPRGDNTTTGGRTHNRRVQIRVLSLSRGRAAALGQEVR
ncbi:MAG: chemotaxis protein MotB [Planctomycetota bacterium]|jgi:chemotaxis protein MotB